MDAVPGMPTSFWFVPNKSTEEMRKETGNPDFNYEIACAEVCGRGHFSMRMLVVVEEPEAFEKWKSEQEPWLSKNPEYLTKVPDDLRELALLKTGLDKQ
jgi:cytochrome c oxidase subunit 2